MNHFLKPSCELLQNDQIPSSGIQNDRSLLFRISMTFPKPTKAVLYMIIISSCNSVTRPLAFYLLLWDHCLIAILVCCRFPFHKCSIDDVLDIIDGKPSISPQMINCLNTFICREQRAYFSHTILKQPNSIATGNNLSQVLC